MPSALDRASRVFQLPLFLLPLLFLPFGRVLLHSQGLNNPPRAVITAFDPLTGEELEDGAWITAECGMNRLIFDASNSDDGDGGVQGLSYEWYVFDGAAGGALIPEATRHSERTEITFVIPGEYVIGLEVDDGGETGNVSETGFGLFAMEPEENFAPTAVIATRPDPPQVELVDGQAAITLDATLSTDGIPGGERCHEGVFFHWRQLSGPGEATAVIVEPYQAVTEVLFTTPGVYIFELRAHDWDLAGTDQVEVEVKPSELLPRFRRGDADRDGRVDITDPIRALNWLFLGAETPGCLDAADADDSGTVDITDAVFLLQFLFSGGPPPSPPGPAACGSDPSQDVLPACVYPNC